MKAKPLFLTLLIVLLLAGGGWFMTRLPIGDLRFHAAQQAAAPAATPTVEKLTEPAPQMAAPAINWTREPQANKQSLVSLAFRIDASAPIRTIRMRVKPVVSMPGIGLAEDTIDVPAFALGRKTVEWDGTIDLTRSLFSGLPVTLQIIGEDQDRRVGEAPPVAITLPERAFSNPLAQNLYTIRKNLQQSPDQRLEALRGLAAILQDRKNFAGQDLTLLSLRSAAVRIAIDRSEAGLRSALDLLWQAALLVEDNRARTTANS